MRIDFSLNTQGLNLSTGSDILSKLNVGDTVRAQVLNITSDELLLKLSDGTTFTAALAADITAQKGELFDFLVKQKTDSQLFLETVKHDTKSPGPNTVLSTDTLKKELSLLDIKATPQNEEIARQLKSVNLPLNKDVFQKVLNSLTAFKDINAVKAAYLTVNQIAIEEKNISALNQIVEKQFKIGAKMEELVSLISDIQDEALSDKLKNVFIQGNQTHSIVEQGKNAPNRIHTPEKQGDVNAIAENVPKAIEEGQESAVQNLPRNIQKEPHIKEQLFQNLQNLQNIQKSKGQNATQQDILDILENTENRELKALLSEKGIADTLIKSLTGKLHQAIQDESEKNSTHPLSGNDESGDRIKTILKKAFEDLYVKTSSQKLQDDLGQKENYNELYRKLELIKNVLETTPVPGKEGILQKIENIEGMMKFINEINQHSTYIQIPIQMNNAKTTGELYVLKRDNKKKKIDPQNATLFISLTTENIGKVDSLVSVNKKNVSINMRLEKKEIIQIFKAYQKELYQSLKEKGYKLVDMKYRLIEEDINLLNIEEFAKKEVASTQQSIDFKI